MERKTPDMPNDQPPATHGPEEQVETKTGESEGDKQAPEKVETREGEAVECPVDKELSFEESGLQSPNAASSKFVSLLMVVVKVKEEKLKEI